MWMNMIKLGGYAMMGKEIVTRIQEVQQLRQQNLRRSRTTGMAMGVTIGSVAGIMAGILLAPRSGRETREQIAVQAGGVYENLKTNVADARSRVSATISEGRQRVRQSVEGCTDAVVEAFDKSEEKKQAPG